MREAFLKNIKVLPTRASEQAFLRCTNGGCDGVGAGVKLQLEEYDHWTGAYVCPDCARELNLMW